MDVSKELVGRGREGVREGERGRGEEGRKGGMAGGRGRGGEREG